MTTITIDDGTLKSVDKLQSLLKLRFDSFSGENITRGGTVNWAVNQQISTMTVPVNLVDGTSFQTPTMSFTSNMENAPGQPIMVAYMASSSTVPSSTATDMPLARGYHDGLSKKSRRSP
jgi:hypothetical protein